MGVLDDILSGASPSAARGGTGAPSYIDAIMGGLGVAANVYTATLTAKAAKSAAKAVVGSPGVSGLPSIPTLGTGNMSIPAGYGSGAMVIPAKYTQPTPVTSSNVMDTLGSKYPNTVLYGDHVYVNRGRPLLYSGDLSACKRVQKVAAKAHRAIGRRRPR